MLAHLKLALTIRAMYRFSKFETQKKFEYKLGRKNFSFGSALHDKNPGQHVDQKPYKI